MSIKLVRGYQMPSGTAMDYAGYAGGSFAGFDDYREAMFHGVTAAPPRTDSLYDSVRTLGEFSAYCCNSPPRYSRFRGFNAYGAVTPLATPPNLQSQGEAIQNSIQAALTAQKAGQPSVVPPTTYNNSLQASVQAIAQAVGTSNLPTSIPAPGAAMSASTTAFLMLVGLYMIQSIDATDLQIIYKPQGENPQNPADVTAATNTLSALVNERNVPSASLPALITSVQQAMLGITPSAGLGSMALLGGLGVAGLVGFLWWKRAHGKKAGSGGGSAP